MRWSLLWLFLFPSDDDDADDDADDDTDDDADANDDAVAGTDDDDDAAADDDNDDDDAFLRFPPFEDTCRCVFTLCKRVSVVGFWKVLWFRMSHLEGVMYLQHSEGVMMLWHLEIVL